VELGDEEVLVLVLVAETVLEVDVDLVLVVETVLEVEVDVAGGVELVVGSVPEPPAERYQLAGGSPRHSPTVASL